MNQIYSQCDDSEHPNEYIVGLCFDKSCLQKPEYCFLCKTEGKHINHQDQCKSFSNLKTTIQQIKNKLFPQKEYLLTTLKNVSQLLSEMLYQIYQKKLDDCQELISISCDENVQQSKMRIDLFQYYLNLNLEDLRQVLDKVDKICHKFNDDMKKVMEKFQNPIMNEESYIEQSFQEISSQQQIQQAVVISDDEDSFKLQLYYIQEEEQAQKIQKSLQLTNEANQTEENPEKAIQLLDQAIELFENNEEALLSKGKILFQEGKYDLSMEIFQKLIQLNSQSPEVYSNYATCLNQKGRFQEADQFYQKAIELNQNDSLSYQNRGHNLCQLGKFQDAIECCDKAIAFDKENSSLYNIKAHALSNLNRIQESLDNYDLAIHFEPSEITFLANKGTLLLNLNELEKANVCLNQIEIQAAKNELYFKFKSGLLKKQGKLAEALETCNLGLEFYPDSQALLEKKQQLLRNVYNGERQQS